MDYIKWKRRIEMCGIMLLLFPPVLLLAMVDGLLEYRQENVIPVEIKYPLSEVPEDQAVLIQSNSSGGIAFNKRLYDVIVNKEGKWKLIDYSVVDVNELYQKENSYEFFDGVLQDDRVPWQKKRIGMNPVLLERALNMPEVEFEKTKHFWTYYRPVYYGNIKSYSYLSVNSPDRQIILYSTGTPKKCDYAPIYIQCKMKQLGTLGQNAMNKKR